MTGEKKHVTQDRELLRQVLGMLRASAEGVSVLRDLAQEQFDQHSELWRESEGGEALQKKIGAYHEALGGIEETIARLDGLDEARE